LNDEVITASSLNTKAENAAVTSSNIDTDGESRDGRQSMNGSLGLALSMDTNKTKHAVEHMTNENLDCNTAKSKTIRITSITAKWTEDLPKNTLTDVSLDVKPGELVAVVGPVGSGKVSYTSVVGKGNRLSSADIFVHRGDVILAVCYCCRHHCYMPF
jgi:ABC-type glutathione transport system ATPase component